MGVYFCPLHAKKCCVDMQHYHEQIIRLPCDIDVLYANIIDINKSHVNVISILLVGVHF